MKDLPEDWFERDEDGKKILASYVDPINIIHNDFETHPIGTGKRIKELTEALEHLISSCQAIIDNRHEDLGERDDVEPYLKNRLMIARKALQEPPK